MRLSVFPAPGHVGNLRRRFCANCSYGPHPGRTCDEREEEIRREAKEQKDLEEQKEVTGDAELRVVERGTTE